MNEKLKDEFLTLFSIALTAIAVSTMVFMARSPSLTGSAVLEANSATTVVVVALLVLAGLAVVIGAIVAIHKLSKEVHDHKEAVGENKTTLIDDPKDDLAKYIVGAYEKGYTDQQVRDRLLQLGWSKKDISSHLSLLKNQKS